MTGRAALLLFALAGCAAGPGPDPIYREAERARPHQPAPRPDFPGYGERIGRGGGDWSAESLTEDFLELVFVTEWGDRNEGLLRFDGPVRVALAGPELSAYRPYAADLVARLRAGAPGLDLSLAAGDEGEITLRTAPADEMSAVAEDALCFFLPFSGGWADFRIAASEGRPFWRGLERFEAITVFLPAHAAPHEIRACIEEEVTQALGPTNDILRLEDSIFNDDNVQVKATAFDLLMLRILYDPSMRAGMAEAEARRAARALLAPLAQGEATRPPGPRDGTYAALAARAATAEAPAERFVWARRAIREAETFGPEDHRLPAAILEAGHIAFFAGREAEAAALLREGERLLLRRLGPDSLRLADLRGDLAAVLMRRGEPGEALAALDPAIPVLAQYGADWRLAHALRWRALALSELGRTAEAARDARRALDWAAYVYGGDSRALAAWRFDFAAAGLAGA